MTQDHAIARGSRPAMEQTLGGSEHFDTELLGTISHELRSPLAAIKGYAATLRRHSHRLSRQEREEFLDAIDLASDRLTAIVDRLLTLSQLEMGAILPTRAAVDVRRLVEASIAVTNDTLLRESDSRHGFELDVVDADGHPWPAPAFAWGDARLLGQLVDALLENAVKYWPDGGTIELTIRMPPALSARTVEGRGPEPLEDSSLTGEESGQPVGRHIELIVRDKGIGIAQEHLDSIFDRFHRVDTRLTRETGGLGLGLTLARCIVGLHQGFIWVESEPGDGSAFHVLLPAADSA